MFRLLTPYGLGSIYTPVRLCLRIKRLHFDNRPLTFWFQAYQCFWLVRHHGAYDCLLMLSIPYYPSPHAALALAASLFPHGLSCFLLQVRCPRRFAQNITAIMQPGRVRVAKHSVQANFLLNNSTDDFTSHKGCVCCRISIFAALPKRFKTLNEFLSLSASGRIIVLCINH